MLNNFYINYLFKYEFNPNISKTDENIKFWKNRWINDFVDNL